WLHEILNTRSSGVLVQLLLRDEHREATDVVEPEQAGVSARCPPHQVDLPVLHSDHHGLQNNGRLPKTLSHIQPDTECLARQEEVQFALRGQVSCGDLFVSGQEREHEPWRSATEEVEVESGQLSGVTAGRLA